MFEYLGIKKNEEGVDCIALKPMSEDKKRPSFFSRIINFFLN